MLVEPSATAPVRAPRPQVFTADIRPAVTLAVADTRKLLTGLGNDDVRRGGVWEVRPGQWRRYSEPWTAEGDRDAHLIGTVHCLYDKPTRYMTTLYRATLTGRGVMQGWTFDALLEDVLWHGGLTLGDCARVDIASAPRVYAEPVIRLP
ncbi:MAG TPA: hypothetical protein VHE83_18825 [Mycobacteriales bacterium]|nr:hypothetical protein [Mycobacteriales bacterium]